MSLRQELIIFIVLAMLLWLVLDSLFTYIEDRKRKLRRKKLIEKQLRHQKWIECEMKCRLILEGYDL